MDPFLQVELNLSQLWSGLFSKYSWSDIDNNSNNDNTVSTDNTVNTDNSISKGDVIYIGESNVYNTIESSSECKNKEENIEELNEDAEVKTQEKNNDEIENQNEDLKEIPKDIEVFDKTQTKKKRGRPKKELEEKDKNIAFDGIVSKYGAWLCRNCRNTL